MKRFPFAKIKAFLNEYDSKFHMINWGGCAVSAHILAQHLAPFVEELKIRAFDRWESSSNIDEVRSRVKNNTVQDWNNVGVAFSHVWVEFKWLGRWYAVDSDGIFSRKKMYRIWGVPFEGSFTLDEMKGLAGTPRGWNWTFSRSQIPHMRKFAKKHLRSTLQAA